MRIILIQFNSKSSFQLGMKVLKSYPGFDSYNINKILYVIDFANNLMGFRTVVNRLHEHRCYGWQLSCPRKWR